MSKLSITRRSFLKAGVATLVAAMTVVPAIAEAENLAGVYKSADKSVKRIRTCCRGCGKMECGVIVTVENGRAVKIEGDEAAWQSRGNCCAKSQASIQAAYHPDRLQYPLVRSNPKGDATAGWRRVTWDEAWETCAKGFKQHLEKWGDSAALTMQGTSRPTAMTVKLYGDLVGAANRYAAFAICKGPRYFASLLLDQQDFFWSTPTLRPNVYVQWGTECVYSNYDDAGRTVIDAATSAAKHILVDPRVTPLGKECDYHLNIRPGTDAAIGMCWFHLVEQKELYDDLFVKRWTNAPYLVCKDMAPTGGLLWEEMGGQDIRTHLLKESDLVEGGAYYRFYVWDNLANDGEGGLVYYDAVEGHWQDEEFKKPTTGVMMPEIYPGMGEIYLPDSTYFDPLRDPALYGEFEVTLKDGSKHTVVPVWQLYAERCMEFTPEYTEKITTVKAQVIEEALMEYATRVDPRFGNGAIHCQLATDQTGNPIPTIRAIRWVSIILGNEDTPGGYRGETLAPCSVQVGGVPKGDKHPPLLLDDAKNWPAEPQDLRLTDPSKTSFNKPDKTVSGERFPLLKGKRSWADADCIWEACLDGTPYFIKAGVCVTGNVLSQSNPLIGYQALSSLDFFLDVDIWHCPTSELADVLLPAAHWLECNTARRSQGSAGAWGANVKCIPCPGEALEDGEITEGFYKAMGVPWGPLLLIDDDPWPPYYPTYLEAGMLSKDFGMTWEQFVDWFQENGWQSSYKTLPQTFGQYRRYEMCRMRSDVLPGFKTPTGKVELWSTNFETWLPSDEEGTLPYYAEPHRSPVSRPDLAKEYPIILTSGARNPTYFHSEHRQLPWCREQWPAPRLEINPADAAEWGIKQGDWVWIENDNGKIRQVADLYYGIERGTVNANHTWWFPELPSAKRGYDLSAINCLVTPHDGCKYIGSSSLRAYLVKVYKATPENSPFGNPVPCDDDGTEIIYDASDPRLKEWVPGGAGVQVDNG
ncbi:MAG: molybdopterin-dependent oxidoreductase [Coriobacteriales bacterium]|nr:molybdopterin-dependent oxidoreductase [Coriobacteriales bacterium]